MLLYLAIGSLRSIANSTTSAVIALLSLIAVIVLSYGLIRAVVMNRRTQIVVADLVAAGGSAELAEATMLSPVLRQCVERHVNDQREHIARIETILSLASLELEPKLDDAVERIQRAANDSIATLTAALRVVAPETADRFLGLFSVILPPPRGILVNVMLLQRGTSVAPRAGAAVEIVRLDRRPLASAAFWETSPALPVEGSGEPGTADRFLSLFEPVARWIAVRLVVALMVSPRRHATSRTRQKLRRLLAGGLFLAAMRDFPANALAFGELACIELAQARLLMPGMPLPVTTLAGVYERMGWARRLAGNSVEASDDFRAAVSLWQNAESLTRGDPQEGNKAKLAILVDRRLKAQFESDDPALRIAALAELGSVTEPEALLSNHVWLYNRSCLYAQASKADPHADYQQQALHWLGLALLRACEASLWDYAERHDPELAPIREFLTPFLASLRSLISYNPAECSQADAEELVARALGSTYGRQ